MRAPMAVGVRKSNGVPRHGLEIAERDQSGVHRRDVGRGNGHDMAENVALAARLK
jgi:hypothetical protein